jgi:hypothetical protein
MTTSLASVFGADPVGRLRQSLRPEALIIIWVLFLAVAFNLVHLYPDLAVKIPDRNDTGMHLLYTDMAVKAITNGQNFTDPWQSTMGMGFPVFHYYQHLPHVTVALAHVLTLRVIPLADMLNWTTYLLLSLFPLSIFWSLRRFGFDRLTAAMGGLVASLTATNSLWGFGFEGYVFRGWGLWSQLWAMLLLPPALAEGYRVLRDGRGYFWAALLLAATLMSHLLYGYMAFLTLGILTFIQPMDLSDPRSVLAAMWKRWRRLLILFLLVVVVTSYFLVPVFLDRAYLNNNNLPQITYDSFGHSAVLQGLAKGYMFDFGRFPSLTILTAFGFVICLLRWRKERYVIPVAIFFLWLLLFFGRATWGALIDLLPMSRDLHMIRFMAMVHLGGIYLMAVALAAPWRWVVSRSNVWYFAAVFALTLLILLPAYSERRAYLTENASYLTVNQQALAEEERELSALFGTLKQLPSGRIYAGLPENWGSQYVVGRIPMYFLLHQEGLNMTGWLYHRFSLTSEFERIFDETRWEQYNLFNVRYVVAPEGRVFPGFVKPLGQFGRHHLYEVQTTGYFDLVDSDVILAGGREDYFPAASSWAASGLLGVKQHPQVLIGRSSREIENSVPLSAAPAAISKIQVSAGPSRGIVVSEEVGGNFFAAGVKVERDSLLMLKATYHPNWRATVNGVETDPVMLMPSVVGIQLPPGEHQVRLEYRPRRLRMVLLALGLLALPLIAIGEKWGAGPWG